MGRAAALWPAGLHGLRLAAHPFLLPGPTAQCGLSLGRPDCNAQDFSGIYKITVWRVFFFLQSTEDWKFPITAPPFYVFLEGEVRSRCTSLLNSSAPMSGSLLISQKRLRMPTLDWLRRVVLCPLAGVQWWACFWHSPFSLIVMPTWIYEFLFEGVPIYSSKVSAH